jgi:para-aminobenzoate synthetase component 1
MHRTQFIETLNSWGGEKTPFFFMVDFEMKNPMAFQLQEISTDEILYDFNGKTNAVKKLKNKSGLIHLRKCQTSLNDFEKKFLTVFSRLEYGDSYLTNLTMKTKVQTDLSLSELFSASTARYKLLYKNKFVVFSPEQFIQIKEGKIFSFPMKGTIDAAIPNAGQIILHDEKELAEHVTIVDLIRNDLSSVARNVIVSRFRYLEEIKTTGKSLIQVSSEVQGELPENYSERLGDILMRLLPAGSISGAPKEKTIQIIRHAEGEERGFYTGVAGIFDGQNLDSGVLIRFIENINGNLFYRSGGGITTQSILEKEYQEVIDKVYVPVD